MEKMTLKKLYELAYGGEEPFVTPLKNSGDFFFANIVAYLSDCIVNNKVNTYSPIDIYINYLSGLGLDLNDVYFSFCECTDNAYFDTRLFEAFSGDPLFDDCRDKILALSEEEQKVFNLNVSKCDGDVFDFSNDFLFVMLKKSDYFAFSKPVFNKKGKDYSDSKAFIQLKKIMDVFFDGAKNAKDNEELLKDLKNGAKYVAGKLGLDSTRLRALRIKMLDACNNEICNRIKKYYFNDKRVEDVSDESGIESISGRVIGQRHAIDKVQKRLRSSMYGFRLENKPIASFLLTGPTGVGKTETAKAVANACFDGKLHVVDMSTFKNDIDVSRLLGGSPNYAGYGDKVEFCEFLIENPRSVILFDEIEKAHPQVLDVLMRILDEGQFVNAKGVTISLEECVIFCTTNYTQNKKKVCGFNGRTSADELMTGEDGLRKELVGRFNEVVEYLPLTREECKKIARVSFLDKLIANFEERNKFGLTLNVTDEVLDKIVDKANTGLFGARDLNKTIQSEFVDPVCEYISKVHPKNETLTVWANGKITTDADGQRALVKAKRLGEEIER